MNKLVFLATLAFLTELEFNKTADKVNRDSTSQTALPPPTKGEVGRQIRIFTPLEYISEVDASQPYRLFIPDKAKAENPSRSWPMIVWMHGYGESGDDNWRHLVHIREEVARWQEELGGFPAFALATQSPVEDHWGIQQRKFVADLIEDIIDNWPIDKDRVYLMGVSSGGNAAWELAIERPNIFAGMVVMGSAPGKSDIASIETLPIWAFHATMDAGISPDRIRQITSTFQSKGFPIWLTETPGKNHDCWTAAFLEYDAVEWLLSQQRQRSARGISVYARWHSFQTRFLIWEELWPTFTLLCGVAFLVWAIRRHLRMNRTRKPNKTDEGNEA